MTDVTLFLKEFARARRDTGAIAPSSPRLARALTRYVIPSPGHPRAVLEVGPGTGAVTRHIRAVLGPLDSLELVEANPRFAALLGRAYAADPQVRLRTGPVQEQRLASYDTIVCGLPFANFDAATADDILRCLIGALRPGGTLSFFAYSGLRPLRRAVVSGAGLRRELRTQAVVQRALARHRFRTEAVLCNLPPARVHHLAPAAPPARAERIPAPA
ncbi:class I SAM-dependent methyltransferase [Streptomyces sp. ODS05-4]|uniref:class I SAM-dependent methyltransferase n=1 Tax=Streptomyces sp. ODS05-4 TaxID=2944939 RepID=UPI00210D0552|nr:methyltransferase [Streptomyces sp. ODS05-4]